MTPKEDLILKAARLASESPVDWREFLKAFETYAELSRKDLVQSPLEALQINQGRARECAALSTLFADAVNTAARIQTRRN